MLNDLFSITTVACRPGITLTLLSETSICLVYLTVQAAGISKISQIVSNGNFGHFETFATLDTELGEDIWVE